MKTMSKTFKTLLGGGSILVLSLLAISHAGAQSCVAPPADLVSWWPGDGNFNDIVDANSGTDAGGTTFTTGEVGQAFSFDGVNDYVEIANAPNLNFGTGSFTVDFWINYPTTAQTATVVVHGASSSVTPSEAGWAIRLQNDQLENDQLVFDIRDETGQVSGRPVGGVAAPSAGQWHHVALVIDRPGSTARLYVNGVESATATMPTGFGSTNSNGNPAIGASNRGGAATNGEPTEFFNGLVDEVEIFNRALVCLPL